jgi:RNA polymerase sigma factor (sigma-70 family)
MSFEQDSRTFLSMFSKEDLHPLVGREARYIARRAKAGDEAAITRMLGAVAKVMIKYAINRAKKETCEVPLEDMLQNASIMLIRLAIPKFDPDIALWNTYAHHWIRSSTQRSFFIDRTIRLGSGAYVGGRNGSLAAAQKLGHRDFGEMMHMLHPTSLDKVVSKSKSTWDESERVTRVIDFVKNPWWANGYDRLEHIQLKDLISSFLRPPWFDARDVFVYCCRFRLEWTLQEVGDVLKLSRERVRQVEYHMVNRLEEHIKKVKKVWHFAGRCAGWLAPSCQNSEEIPTGHCWDCWAKLCSDVGAENSAGIEKPKREEEERIRPAIQITEKQAQEMGLTGEEEKMGNHNVRSDTLRQEMREAGLEFVRQGSNHEIWKRPDGGHFPIALGGKKDAPPAAVQEVRSIISNLALNGKGDPVPLSARTEGDKMSKRQRKKEEQKRRENPTDLLPYTHASIAVDRDRTFVSGAVKNGHIKSRGRKTISLPTAKGPSLRRAAKVVSLADVQDYVEKLEAGNRTNKTTKRRSYEEARTHAVAVLRKSSVEHKQRKAKPEPPPAVKPPAKKQESAPQSEAAPAELAAQEESVPSNGAADFALDLKILMEAHGIEELLVKDGHVEAVVRQTLKYDLNTL